MDIFHMEEGTTLIDPRANSSGGRSPVTKGYTVLRPSDPSLKQEFTAVLWLLPLS